MGFPPNNGKRKVPAGPKAQPKKPSGNAASSTSKQSPRGINPSSSAYGIIDTSRKHTSAVTQSFGRNVPTGQKLIEQKVKRQVY